MSRDGTAAIVPALLAADADEADVVAAAEDAFAGSDVVLGGSEVAQDQISSQVQADLLRAELIALPLLLLLSLWIFRSPVAALLPVLVGASTVMGTFLVLRVVDATAMGLSAFALNLVTGLGLGLAVDYSLLLVVPLPRGGRARAHPGGGRRRRARHLGPHDRLQRPHGVRGDAGPGRLPAALPAVHGHRRGRSSRSSRRRPP